MSRTIVAFVLVVLLVAVVVRRMLNSCAGKWERWARRRISAAPRGEDVCIVGAGVSGLSTAYFLKPMRVTMLEERTRLGGNNYSSWMARLPMRYGCSLTHQSPTLMSLTKELDLTWTPMPEHSVVTNGTNAGVPFARSDIVSFLPTYARSVWLYHFSDEAMRRNVGDLFGTNFIFDSFVSTCGGINMFVDRQDFRALSAEQTAAYVLRAFPGKFSFITGGNHQIIDRLAAATHDSATRHLGHRVERIELRNDDELFVDGTRYDSVVVTPPPHVAKHLLDASFVLHHAVFQCFETTHAFSCVHEDHSVFDDISLTTSLRYDFDEHHHTMHIDAAWYGLAPPRRLYVSYWYDTTPCPVDPQKIIERSRVVLSRVIAERRDDLWAHLMRLKTEHRNVHLSNACYSGWMWHEDACVLSKQIAVALRQRGAK